MPKTLDPITLATFMTLPGAAELVEAFADIPPGPLRDSVVHHAQVIRLTYLGGGVATGPIPSTPAFGPAQEAVARALSGPRRGDVLTEDPEVKAVELMLQGTPPHVVAEQTGLTIKETYAAKKKARTAGLVFQHAPKGKPNNSGRIRGRPHVTFHTSMDGVDSRSLSNILKAAEKRGISADAYMARRKLALEMSLEGRHVRAIMEATKESKSALQQWFYQAREAGHPVAYINDYGRPSDNLSNVVEPAIAPATAAPTNVIDLPRKTPVPHQKGFATTMSEARSNGSVFRGAKLMGISGKDFLTLRRKALELFTDGETPASVADQLGLTRKQALNWRERARQAGKLPMPDGPVILPKAVIQRNAAESLGLTPADYEALRTKALEMFAAGHFPAAVARELNLPFKRVANWKTNHAQRLRAREA